MLLNVSMSSLRSVSEAKGCAERERPAQHRAADKRICAENVRKRHLARHKIFVSFHRMEKKKKELNLQMCTHSTPLGEMPKLRG